MTLGEGARELVLSGDPFRIDLAVRGTERLGFLPLGEVTTARLTADWPDPGFDGGALPQERKISRDGFSASWNVPYFVRSYPQEWSSNLSDEKALRLQDDARSSAFGVTLVRPADQYQQTERSVKYAILFIVLTFVILALVMYLTRKLDWWTLSFRFSEAGQAPGASPYQGPGS